jgi:hypothetical protein
MPRGNTVRVSQQKMHELHRLAASEIWLLMMRE